MKNIIYEDKSSGNVYTFNNQVIQVWRNKNGKLVCSAEYKAPKFSTASIDEVKKECMRIFNLA